MNGGIYEFNGDLFYGDGRSAEPMPLEVEQPQEPRNTPPE